MSATSTLKSRNGNKVLNNNDAEVPTTKNHKKLTNSFQNTDDSAGNNSRSMVTLIFISLLFDLLAFTMILPLMPSLLEHYRQNDSSGLYNLLTQRIHWFQQLVGAPERYTSVLYGGFLGSMFSFLQFVASPIVGGLSDYYGPRFVGGISKGNISLCMSIITDVSSVKTRAFGMALVGVAFSIGFIAGPTIGALFARSLNKSVGSWYLAPSLCAFAFALCDLGIIAFGLLNFAFVPRHI